MVVARVSGMGGEGNGVMLVKGTNFQLEEEVLGI